MWWKILLLILWLVLVVYFDANIISELRDHVSKESFIFGQRNPDVRDLGFGFFRSHYNGCGWIATYNALVLLGKKPKIKPIIREYELFGALLFGVFGLDPFAIGRFFRIRGYRVKTTLRIKKFDTAAENAQANVIFYFFKWGGHFFAFQKRDERFVSYNFYSRDNRPYLMDSVSDTLKKSGALFAIQFSINEKKKIHE